MRKLVEAIKSDKYDVIIINFANPDMVGHTGVEEAAVKAVETVDACVGRAVSAVKEMDGVMFICADHGNAEQLVDYETGAPFTATTNWSLDVSSFADFTAVGSPSEKYFSQISS